MYDFVFLIKTIFFLLLPRLPALFFGRWKWFFYSFDASFKSNFFISFKLDKTSDEFLSSDLLRSFDFFTSSCLCLS